MHAELISYFGAERNGALLLLCMGAVSFAGAFALWQTRSAFLAMMWPLIVFGTFEVLIGGAVFLRTSSQVQQLEARLAEDRESAVADEVVRMDGVNRNFRIVKVVEVVVIGIGLLALFAFPVGSPWYSVGLGLIVQGAALLAFDSFAHHRADVYVEWLQGMAAP
jgi:hypothetical protein